MYHSIASFFVLSSWKIEDASQNFVLLELWTFIFSGRLAELLCWICAHPFFEEIWNLTELPTFR
jgi:hypothetical protein